MNSIENIIRSNRASAFRATDADDTYPFYAFRRGEKYYVGNLREFDKFYGPFENSEAADGAALNFKRDGIPRTQTWIPADRAYFAANNVINLPPAFKSE